MEPDGLNATVVDRVDLDERLAILRIRPDEAPIPDFVPGQFLRVGLPVEAGSSIGKAGSSVGAGSNAEPAGSAEPDAEFRAAAGGVATERLEAAATARLERRAYSIASSPADKDAFEIFVALVDGGRLTPRMWPIRAGGRVSVDPRPLGTFTLERVPRGKDLVLVATGTGIAPYVSMVRAYSRGGALHEPGRWRRCVLVHGARRASDLAYAEELVERARADPSLCYVPIVSREPESSDWSGLRGRVQSVLEGESCRAISGTPLDPETCHVLLCGNPDMIRSVREMLAARGFSLATARRPGNLHFERYW